MMWAKNVFLFLTLLVGCLAYPATEEFPQLFQNAEPDARIVGGTIAPEGSHPHMVALSNGRIIRNFLCGGSIISPRTILTAAHCIDAVYRSGSLSSSLRATIGTNRWNRDGVSHRLTTNATHPNYIAAIAKNDIGFLYTSNIIVYNYVIAPIQLSYDYIPGGVNAKVAGWGRVRVNGAISGKLREVTVDTLSAERCQEEVDEARETTPNAYPLEPHIELCTYRSPGFGTCHGDSGSALVRTDRGTQIGVVSWGFPCARGAPDMFVRISAFQSWLEENTRY